MIKSSQEQSFLFVLDSNMRDRSSYPTPSDYYIPFPVPFRNVFAVDLVDATIPRTEYNVESLTNTLAYAPGSYATYEDARLNNALVEVSIAPGDYNVPQLIQILNDALKAKALEQGHSPLIAQPLSNPVELTNKIVFVRPEPFVLFLGNSSMRRVIGFGNPASTAGSSVAWDSSVRYTTDTLIANDVFAAVPTSLSSELTYAGPVPVELTEYTIALTNPVRQVFTAEASGLLTNVTFRGIATSSTNVSVSVLDVQFDPPALVDTFTILASSSSNQWSLTKTPSTQSVALTVTDFSSDGSFVTLVAANSLVVNNIIVITGASTEDLNGSWALTAVTSTTITFACPIQNPELGDATVTASKEMLEGRTYALEFAATNNVSLYKAQTFTEDEALKLEQYSGGSWTTVSTQDALSTDVGVTLTGYKVEAPGQCNLTGERYVLVRSPDIEQHLHRDLAAAFDRMAPGLGMLKLGGSTGGYREERLNFLAYETRKFHPIGKLKGLHIRLETQTGRLYDTHGIDHTLLLCVKMYAAGPSQNIPRDLYPGYTPDARQALLHKLERER